MEKYQFDSATKAALEKLRVPLAVYQFIDKRVVTILLSDGFCELFGFDNKDDAYYVMDHDMYRATHPEDRARAADAAYRFATEGGRYEVVYRTLTRNKTDYIIVHSLGEHVVTEDGVRLAYIWFTDEGRYTSDSDGKDKALNDAMKNIVREENMIKALSADFVGIYYVNLKNGKFIEYSSAALADELEVERHGTDFFGSSRRKARKRLYSEDLELFLDSFTEGNILCQIDSQGAYTLSYRLLIDGEPKYVSLKAVRIKTHPDHIIVGVNNVDAQVRQKEALERMNQERILFMMVSVYTFVAKAKNELAAKRLRRTVVLSGAGMAALIVVQMYYPMMPLYSMGFLFSSSLLHSFVVEDEKEEQRRELEETLRREQEQIRELGSAKKKIYTDPLTGVKSKQAYIEDEEKLNKKIRSGLVKELGVVVFDVNDLKSVNDNLGHDTGDIYIYTASMMISEFFENSPVYRIGGDEFAVILEGGDYGNREKLLAAFDHQSEENQRSGKVVVASGMAVFKKESDRKIRDIFERADRQMYLRKSELKKLHRQEEAVNE